MKFESPIKTVCQRLNEASTLRGIPQAELCARTGISSGSMSQYFSGYVSPKQNRIILLAKALNVDETWLMGFDVPMDRNVKNSDEEKSSFDLVVDADAKYIIELYSNLSIKHKRAVKKLIEDLS